MMCRMTAVAQGDQITWLIAAGGRAWEKVMNIGYIRIAWLPAFDALELITSKDALSNSAPIPFDCARHDDLALARMAGSQAAHCNGNRAPDARLHQGWISEPVGKREVVGQGYGPKRIRNSRPERLSDTASITG
jgi:hypothetical protein